MRTWLAAVAATIQLVACSSSGGGPGDDGSVADADPNQPDAPPTIDASPPADACTGALDLQVVEDGTGRNPPIVISSLSIAGNYIEVFNRTEADVDLSMMTTEQWCDVPAYRPVRNNAVVVPAKGYATVPLLKASSTTEATGELALYLSSAYSTPTEVLDFVCWGTPKTSTRRGTAVAGGKWAEMDECAPAIPTGGALRRMTGTNGTEPAHYQPVATPDPMNCGP